MKKLILIILTLLCVLVSCRNDDDYQNTTKTQENTDSQFEFDNFGNEILTNFSGRITNQSGHELDNVVIFIGDKITTTDINGVFVINNARVHEKYAYIKAKKDGYIIGSRAVLPNINGNNHIQITMLEKIANATIFSGSSSEVSLPNGAKVEFSGDFIDASGSEYNGAVKVSIHYLEPNQPNTFTQMPGMLFGQREDNSASSMETYGMLAVNLFTASGENLNINSNYPATLTFPISTSTPNAPSEIPLWHFDEAKGYWIEDGVAISDGTQYVAEVTHFSWWNCDLPIEYMNICLDFNYDNNLLTNFYAEIIYDATGQVIFSGTTNELGEICGLLPKNEIISLNLYHNGDCSQTQIFNTNLGPYSTDQNVNITLPNLSLPQLENITLTGTIQDCNANSIANGYAIIYSSIFSTTYPEIISITDGILDYDFTYCINSATTNNIIFYDSDNNLVSDILPLTVAVNNIISLGIISLCNQSSRCIGQGIYYNTVYQGVGIGGVFSTLGIEQIIQLNQDDFKTVTTGPFLAGIIAPDHGFNFKVNSSNCIITVPSQQLFQGYYPYLVYGDQSGNDGQVLPNGDISITYTMEYGSGTNVYTNYYTKL